MKSRKVHVFAFVFLLPVPALQHIAALSEASLLTACEWAGNSK